MNQFDCTAFAFSQSLEELIRDFDRLEESLDTFDGSSTSREVLAKLLAKGSESLGSLLILQTALKPHSQRAQAFEEF